MKEDMTFDPATMPAMMATTMPATTIDRAWSPILDDALRERALDAVQAIADRLRQPLPEADLNASLAGGQAGLALLYAYLARTRQGGDEAETAGQFLVDALE